MQLTPAFNQLLTELKEPKPSRVLFATALKDLVMPNLLISLPSKEVLANPTHLEPALKEINAPNNLKTSALQNIENNDVFLALPPKGIVLLRR